MERFLGCPIEVGGVIVGTLYLAEPRVNPTFTESDEHTLALYAAAAGTAINNARRFDALARRESLLAGLHAINAAALAPAGAVADTLVRVATRLWQARGATLHDAHADSTNTAPAPLAHHGEAAEPDSTELRIAIEAPHGYWELRVWGAAATPSPAEVAQLRAHAALALDFVAHERTFAAAALTAERERLAADLHDRVIQRVFAVGLELQRVAAGPVGREVTEAITFAIDALDSVVVDLRQAIFELHHGVLRPVVSAIQHEVSVAHTPETLAVSDVYDVADEAEAPDDVVDALVLVTREALANVVRHAHTDVASLSLRLDGTTWILTISDCGCGIPDGVTRRSGISNMRRRVARAGGTLSVRANEPSGTVVSVVIPGATERRAP
jgi:signal transduction histidine kinase